MNMKTMLEMFSLTSRKTSFIIILLSIALLSFTFATEHYEEIYPAQYKTALALKDIYSDLLKEKGITDTDFYIAIVFPEMMRYTAIRDEFETLLTKITYTTIQDYDGCSISPFQMKPNFIEDLEHYISEDAELKEKYSALLFEENISDFSRRYGRIVRLQSHSYQVQYLMAFVDICMEKYNLENEPKEKQLKIIATAYNSGLKNKSVLYQKMKQKSFPEGANSPKSKWNYAELCLHYYKMFM